MVELSESYVLARQINETLPGKTIVEARANTHPHGFAWYTGDPAEYNVKLSGRHVTQANPGTGYTCGGNVEIICKDMLLVLSTPIKYHAPGEKLPAKHQLLLTFDDGSHMSCTVQMWGCMFCYPLNAVSLPESFVCNKAPTPLSDGFTADYFDDLWRGVKQNMSAKAFLATEQRFPGLGNGVLQDILWNAGIHPKRKLETLSDADEKRMYRSVRETLREMTDLGGRDTERDLFSKPGGYRTILSKKTLPYPCPACGNGLIREAYLGGNIYFCPTCQPLR